MKRLDESLASLAKVRVTVSLEERVMAQVRVAAARRGEGSRIGAWQTGLLLAAAVVVLVVEGSGWLGLVRAALPHRLAPFTQGLLQLFFVALRLLGIVAQWERAVGHGVMVGLLSLPVLATLAIILSFVLLIAVRRARRPAAARGLS
jgi:hypothetical protein